MKLATASSRTGATTHPPNPASACRTPITLGHQYSLLAYLPDKLPGIEAAWIVPLIWRRISTQESELAVAAAQVATLLTDERMPFHNGLCFQVATVTTARRHSYTRWRNMPIW